MRRKTAAALITLMLLVVTYGLLFAYFNVQKGSMPKAAEGVLDLSGWRFQEDGTIRLDGEWELYPGKLLGEREPVPLPSEAVLVQVPGSWAAQGIDTLGASTYRLRIRLGEADGVFGLKTAAIQLANRLIVNGQVVGESGNPADKANYSALNKPYVSYFELQPGWNEIRIQVANYDFKAGSGILQSIVFGQAGQVAAVRERALAHDWVALTAFLIMGLYFVGLYTQRRNDPSHVVFGAACIFIALYTSVSGERVLLTAIGPLPFWLYYRLQIISVFGVGLGFLLYVYTAFRPYCFRWLVRGGLAAGLAFLALNIGFASLLTAEPWRQLSSIYVTVSLLYATYVFVLTALHRIAGSAYLAIAALALNALTMNQNLNVYFGMPIYSLPPVEPFLVLLMLALLMSLRFSNAFRKIEDLSEQLLQADKMKDDFLARTSHEFKTPLHGIMNISRSMLDDLASPPTAEQREKLELVSDISRRLSRLVYDILDLSKLKQGQLSLTPVPVDVHAVAEMQVRFYSYLSTEKRLQLVNGIPAELPLALADESRLSQIIGNLLDNAVKHTEQGSVVVTGTSRDGWLEISVQDTGKGIEERDLPYIFEPFKSLEGSQGQGFGLGLSIARQLVELQGGELSAVSAPGAGSVFTFTLPAAEQGVMPAATRSYDEISPKEPDYSFATPHHANANGKHTILVADDQFVNLKVLLDALRGPDYHVIAVKDGYEALGELDRAKKVDLVVLDLMMPGMSGFEVCQDIRKRYSLLELPVLMVTAAIQPQDKVAAFLAGANDYLPKPFDLEELRARIGSLLAMKASHGRAIHMEVAFLQSQIKPHFLYNALNSILASSYTDVERARRTIVALADYLRGSFRFSNAEGSVEFAEEFGLIHTYVEIERARFRDRIRFEYEIEDGALGVRIPPLSLQPLVENAIRHGIGDRLEGGTVKLSAQHTEDGWRFAISDDGVGIPPEKVKTLFDPIAADGRQGVGLLNIDKRLRYEYGRTLTVESEPGTGTTVTLWIPASSG
ncbi:hybrid sensor histidine kinase/response regulator [Cohnella fermenti]|uniref:histidine kinase n=1 Tax=Cohnella fermenti TaxID=2565925 RepID=A0A4S4C698_9BACL|nr:ATP-binding protein [Cohnella fermenti]THF83315.1 response regulator [Cohnella fermenti]